MKQKSLILDLWTYRCVFEQCILDKGTPSSCVVCQQCFGKVKFSEMLKSRR
jgi:hypothetical protein